MVAFSSPLALTLAATFRANIIASYENDLRRAQYRAHTVYSAAARRKWVKDAEMAEIAIRKVMATRPEDYLKNAITYIGNNPNEFRHDLVE